VYKGLIYPIDNIKQPNFKINTFPKSRLLIRFACPYGWFSGAPLPPFAVNITSCANLSTTLSWNVTLPQDLARPIGFIIDVAYKHLSRSFPTSSYSKLAEISSGSARSYVVKHLQPHNQFYFRIRAKNQVGVGLPALLPTQVTCVTNSASKYCSIKQDTLCFSDSTDYGVTYLGTKKYPSLPYECKLSPVLLTVNNQWMKLKVQLSKPFSLVLALFLRLPPMSQCLVLAEFEWRVAH